MSLKKAAALVFMNTLVLASIFGIFLVKSSKSPQKEKSKEGLARPIPTFAAQSVKSHSTFTFPGKVKAQKLAHLSFPVGGKIVILNGKVGSCFKKGDLIARLEQREFIQRLEMAKAELALSIYELNTSAQLRFNLEKARVEASHAKREYERYGRLKKQRAAPQTKYELAEATHELACCQTKIEKKSFNDSKKRLESKSSIAALKVKVLEKALSDTSLYAPFDGVVVKRFHERQEQLKARQQLLSFQSVSKLQVVFQLPETLAAKGIDSVLTKCAVKFPANQQSNQWYTAHPYESERLANGETNTFEVILTLPTPQELTVYPGMTATVKIQVEEHPSSRTMARIPLEALARTPNGKTYVWLIPPKGGHPEKRLVTPLSFKSGFIELAKGLTEGELVATAALYSLHESNFVRPSVDACEGLEQ